MKRTGILLLGLALAACSPSTPAAPVTPAAPEAPPAAAAAPILLGVLEDRPPSTTSETNRFMVRAAFQKDGANWKTLDPSCIDDSCLTTSTAFFPKETDWTIVIHGEKRAW